MDITMPLQPMMNPHNPPLGGYGWIVQVIILLIFFLILWWLLKNNNSNKTSKNETPDEILKRRLAAGDITKQEYRDLKKEIGK